MSESSDRELLDLIRRRGPLAVVEMADDAGRDGHGGAQQAARLWPRDWSNGRPSTSARPAQASLRGERRGPQAPGQNYADLAVASGKR